MQNPNYSPVHNPTGLQFDNQQIEYLLNNMNELKNLKIFNHETCKNYPYMIHIKAIYYMAKKLIQILKKL